MKNKILSKYNKKVNIIHSYLSLFLLFSFYTLFASKMCRVRGCTSCPPGVRHFCRVCGDRDSTHRGIHCPMGIQWRSTATTGCRVPGCTSCRPGRTHYCKVCGDQDSSHRARDCPMMRVTTLVRPPAQIVVRPPAPVLVRPPAQIVVRPVRACRVPDCMSCRPGRTHYCRVCGDQDSTHRSSNCPMR